MDRRFFLKGLAGTGVLIASSKLPSFAGTQQPHIEHSKSIFSQRADHERLTLSVFCVNIGLEKPFSALHISDTHLTEAYAHESEKKQILKEKQTAKFGGMQAQALADSLAWAKKNSDYIIHTGDLIDWQSEANFDLVKKYFGEHLFGCLGNHEFNPDLWMSEPPYKREESFKNLTREKLNILYPFNTSFCSQEAHGVNFITLDDSFGTVTTQQVELFNAEVKKGLPIVLCMHVPFINDESYRVIIRFWRGCNKHYTSAAMPDPITDYKAQLEDRTTREFIAQLRKEPLLKAILAGHDHFFHNEQFSPTARQFVVGPNYLFAGEEILFI